MIPRTLVPEDVRPLPKGEALKIGHRLETYMDDRTVVPSGASDAPPIDGKSTIPQHLPLGVLVDRTLVPRGMPATRIESFKPLTEYAPVAVLDSRVVVPAYVEPAAPEEIQEFVEHAPGRMSEARLEVVQPDISPPATPISLSSRKKKPTPRRMPFRRWPRCSCTSASSFSSFFSLRFSRRMSPPGMRLS